MRLWELLSPIVGPENSTSAGSRTDAISSSTPCFPCKQLLRSHGFSSRRVASVYKDFHSESIPVLTDKRTGTVLVTYGGQWLRDLGLAIILDSSYEDWYGHIEHLDERFSRRRKNRRQVTHS